jgi:hypothetical protein
VKHLISHVPIHAIGPRHQKYPVMFLSQIAVDTLLQVYLLILKNKMKLISNSHMAAVLFLYGSALEDLEQPLFPFGRL